MSVDPGFAAWLKQSALYALAPVGGSFGAWGDKAINSTVISPLANESDAQAQATLQAAFLAGPLVQDKIVVKGLLSDRIGKCVTIKGDRLGYEGAGATVFVIGASEGDTTTTLTVLKKGV